MKKASRIEFFEHPGKKKTNCLNGVGSKGIAFNFSIATSVTKKGGGGGETTL